ncbi:hypothetical protein EE612_002886, partial [Oryza sativa]
GEGTPVAGAVSVAHPWNMASAADLFLSSLFNDVMTRLLQLVSKGHLKLYVLVRLLYVLSI